MSIQSTSFVPKNILYPIDHLKKTTSSERVICQFENNSQMKDFVDQVKKMKFVKDFVFDRTEKDSQVEVRLSLEKSNQLKTEQQKRAHIYSCLKEACGGADLKIYFSPFSEK